MHLRRGEVVRVQLDPVEGSEQAGERPTLLIFPDLMNEHSPVILVAAITSRKTDRIYPFEALIETGDGGVSTRSKVILTQIRAIDKRRVVGAYGVVEQKTMARVEDALRVAAGLTPL